MPPMCQSAVEAMDGTPNDWHFVHYVSRAVGGTGLIVIEMTNVESDGLITNRGLGLWSEKQIPAFARIIEGCQKYGAKMAIQKIGWINNSPFQREYSLSEMVSKLYNKFSN